MPNHFFCDKLFQMRHRCNLYRNFPALNQLERFQTVQYIRFHL